MKFTHTDPNAWVENCINCHVAMHPVNSEGEIVLAIIDSFPTQVIDSERSKNNYASWLKNPVLQGMPQFWYCRTCKNLWGVAFGAWVKGQLNSEIEELPPTYISPSGVERVIDYTPPFKGASMCPHCHTWRHIIDTVVRGVGDDQEITNTHFCVECKATQDIIIPSKNSQMGTFVKDNMTLEGLVGERNPIKLSQ